jgi:large subunit ribosomal protein L9
MKVILNKNVKGTGKAGEVVVVSEGYARNFLFRRNLAAKATDGKIKEHKHIVKNERQKKAENKEDALEKKEKIESVEVTISKTAGDNGQLFGSVTKKDIVKQLKKNHKITINKKDMVLENNIKDLGTTKIKVKLYKKISAELKVNVIKE